MDAERCRLGRGGIFLIQYREFKGRRKDVRRLQETESASNEASGQEHVDAELDKR